MSRRLQLLILMWICILTASATPRDLADIRYRFTSCGATSNEGPLFTTCGGYYSANGSPIHRDGVLFEFENNDYTGAQGFRVLKDGLYNITVTGASGGRGICNSEQGGYGVRRVVQVGLTTDLELLVMVGQRGIEPCDVIPRGDQAHTMFCVNPPNTTTQSTTCTIDWTSYANSNYDSRFRNLFGGGGGGGASLVQARNRTSGVFDPFPIVISAGGGGSPAELEYDVLSGVGVAVSYRRFIDGSFSTNSSHAQPGQTGFRINDVSRYNAGAGGGYFPSSTSQTPAPQTGKSFNVARDFATGGTDCAPEVLGTRDIPFSGTFGGFGGGGAGCAGGGGGGGYTGGSVLRETRSTPGGGGFSFSSSFDNASVTNITVIADSNQNSPGDGFVEIVRSDCECVHECVVYEEADQYDCTCPNDTSLAPDMNDCFQDTSISVMEGEQMMLEGNLQYRILAFSDSLYIYSIDVIFEEDTDCLIVFTGANSQIIMISNFVRESENANMLAILNGNPSTVPNTLEYVSFLNSSVLATNAVVVGNGPCMIEEDIRVNASIQVPSSGDGSTLLSNETLAYVSTLYNSLVSTTQRPDSTDRMESSLQEGELAGIIIAVVLVVIFVSIISITTVLCCCRKSEKPIEAVMMRKFSTILRTDLRSRTDSNDYTSDTSHNALRAVHSIHIGELPEGMLVIKSAHLSLGKIIGEGEFGIVRKSQFKNHKENMIQTVAVKTLKGFFDQNQVDELIKESKKMGGFDHPNVLGIIGICLDGGPAPFLILPFMEKGSLLSHLRKNSDTLVVGGQDVDSTLVSRVTVKLIRMCLQIAKGMEYLASKNVIHRDLAARNCMIDQEDKIRVSDFGLSESTYTRTYFRQEDHKSMLLPIKWIAPESHSYGKFSEKTDVWSFGVTCWEVFSGGENPYPSVPPLLVLKFIKEGNRMEKPENEACTKKMYSMMNQCWLTNDEERPTFSDLVNVISTHMAEIADYLPLSPISENSMAFPDPENSGVSKSTNTEGSSNTTNDSPCDTVRIN